MSSKFILWKKIKQKEKNTFLLLFLGGDPLLGTERKSLYILNICNIYLSLSCAQVLISSLHKWSLRLISSILHMARGQASECGW